MVLIPSDSEQRSWGEVSCEDNLPSGLTGHMWADFNLGKFSRYLLWKGKNAFALGNQSGSHPWERLILHLSGVISCL